MTRPRYFFIQFHKILWIHYFMLVNETDFCFFCQPRLPLQKYDPSLSSHVTSPWQLCMSVTLSELPPAYSSWSLHIIAVSVLPECYQPAIQSHSYVHTVFLQLKLGSQLASAVTSSAEAPTHSSTSPQTASNSFDSLYQPALQSQFYEPSLLVRVSLRSQACWIDVSMSLSNRGLQWQQHFQKLCYQRNPLQVLRHWPMHDFIHQYHHTQLPINFWWSTHQF